MSRRRAVTAHTLKRRLMGKLDALGPFECERILVELREYVIARRFLDGASIATLARSETLGNSDWTEARVEAALRRRATVRSPRA